MQSVFYWSLWLPQVVMFKMFRLIRILSYAFGGDDSPFFFRFYRTKQLPDIHTEGGAGRRSKTIIDNDPPQRSTQRAECKSVKRVDLFVTFFFYL